MKELLRDYRIRRLLLANTVGSVGSGITVFAVPWLLVSRPEGSVVFRHATLLTTLVLFALLLFYGAWLDRHSRKTMLLFSEFTGFAGLGCLAVVCGLAGRVETWHLVAAYFLGLLYYTLHYPAKFAMIQQMFEPGQYRSLVGLLEVQGQAAMMLAGGLGGLLVERWSLPVILALDTATYLFSFVLLATLPYRATHLEGERAAPRPIFSVVVEGAAWLWHRPRLNLLLLSTLMPFIVVMASNYLFPVYVTQTLGAGAMVFAWGEIVFAIGAILAGYWAPRFLERQGSFRGMCAPMILFAAGLLLLFMWRHSLVYLLAGLVMGIGNAGTRVGRSSLMLTVVPNEMMGRVGAFYNVADRLLRTLLVLSLGLIDTQGPPAGYLLLFGVSVLAVLGLFLSRSPAEQSRPAALG